MALEPLGAPQPVKLALAPLAAAREVTRLTTEQNQRVREAGLESVQVEERPEPTPETQPEQAAADSGPPPEDAQTAEPEPARPEARGERVDIFA